MVMMMAAMTSPYSIGQTIATRQYTNERPLVYEDAWDLWPYVFLNDRGEPEGFNIDMLKMVFEELGIPYVIKLKPTSEALEDLKAGRSDLMMRLADTFKADYGHYGHEVVTLFTHSVVGPKSKPVTIHAMEDLGREHVIVHWGSLSHRMMVDKGWEANCEAKGDMKEAIQQVSTRGEGYVVWNTLALKWLMRRYKTDNLQITPIEMPYGEYKFMSNDTLLLQRLDSVYARLCATDRMQPILNKWFYPDRVDSGIPYWVEYVVGFIALAVFLLLYYVITLRIRERKMTGLIAKHNRRLALILRTTKVWVWLYDVKRGTVTWMNADGSMDSRQYTMEEFGRTYTPESFERLSHAIDLIVNDRKESHQVELASYEADSRCEYVCTLSVFRRSRRGSPTTVVGMMDDQTERLLSQRKAKDSMLRYQSIFSSSMVDMTYYDTDGILADINQKACQTFHCNHDEIIGEHVPFTFALEDINVKLEDFEGSYSSHIIKATNNFNLADAIHISEDVYYEQQLLPVYDASHRFLGIFGSGRDVSEFVNSYHQLQHSISKLMSAANDVTEYISNINFALHAGGVRLVNYSPSTHLLTIYKEMNVVQLTLTQSRCLSIIDAASKRVASRLLDAMDTGMAEVQSLDVKTTIRAAGGHRLALHFHFIPIYNNEGTVENYFGLCRDISQELAIEEELEREKAKAQEVENVKNAFLHNMSYEIRTPISTVIGFAELFANEHDPADEDGFINEIKNNAAYLLKLVNDILFLSRLDAHMIEFSTSPIDFAGTFEGHCQMGWAKHMKSGVKYIVENPYEQLVLDIDDANVGRIIEQVAENAAINTDTGHVRARYDYIGDKLLVTIEDTGRGMDANRRERLFERFGSAVANSTGLGLPICKELAQQMGGTIHVNTADGRGTTVWVVIPCKVMTVEKKLLTT